MRWLIVLPFARPGHMGMDFRDELQAMGHEARTFAYRRDNPLYKNRSTKATYQLFILRRLERACVAYRPDFVLVILTAIIICFVATIIPSRQAAALDPAQALRYE